MSEPNSASPATLNPAELTRADLLHASPREIRRLVREGRWTQATTGISRGNLQANLAIVPRDYAFDFLSFCLRNPKPCPILEVLDPGDPVPRIAARDADIRTDLSRFRVFRDGQLVEEVPNLLGLWRDDHVGFLMGCSLSFDQAMLDAGIPLRHLDDPNGRVTVYESSIACVPAGRLHGNMVVSMRPVPAPLLMRTIEVTARYPIAHGSPVHIGDPAAIGITDMSRIHSGRFNPPASGEIPVFWGCGVTPQSIALASGIPEMITHATGHMFMTDLTLANAAALR